MRYDVHSWLLLPYFFATAFIYARGSWLSREGSTLQYKISDSPLTCNDAVKFCEGRYAMLAVAKTEADKKFLRQIMLPTNTSSFLIGLGFHQINIFNAGFQWSDGSLYTSNDADWQGGQARDGGFGLTFKLELGKCQCTVQDSASLLWSTTNCTMRHHFVCQRDSLLCNSTDSPCKNDADCSMTNDGVECHCRQGWNGTYCEEDLDECGIAVCVNNAKCSNLPGSFTCTCTVGWTGQKCDEDIEDCVDRSLCYGSSTCVDVAGSFSCVCPQHYTGPTCATDVRDRCSNLSPCLYDSTCTNKPDGSGYTCHCPPGLTGVNCQADVNECLTIKNLCQNHATCLNMFGNYSCRCTDKFQGRNCTDDVDECINTPCPPGSLCVNTQGGHVCHCPFSWTGQDCETPIERNNSVTAVNEAANHMTPGDGSGSKKPIPEESFGHLVLAGGLLNLGLIVGAVFVFFFVRKKLAWRREEKRLQEKLEEEREKERKKERAGKGESKFGEETWNVDISASGNDEGVWNMGIPVTGSDVKVLLKKQSSLSVVITPSLSEMRPPIVGGSAGELQTGGEGERSREAARSYDEEMSGKAKTSRADMAYDGAMLDDTTMITETARSHGGARSDDPAIVTETARSQAGARLDDATNLTEKARSYDGGRSNEQGNSHEYNRINQEHARQDETKSISHSEVLSALESIGASIDTEFLSQPINSLINQVGSMNKMKEKLDNVIHEQLEIQNVNATQSDNLGLQTAGVASTDHRVLDHSGDLASRQVKSSSKRKRKSGKSAQKQNGSTVENTEKVKTGSSNALRFS